MLDWLWDAIVAFAQWLLDVLLWVPLKLWEIFLDVFATIIEAIPVPEFVTNAGLYVSAVPSSVLFFLSIVRLDYGLSVVIGAAIIRFVIRRLPVIG